MSLSRIISNSVSSKHDKQLRIFSPIVLFHDHTYKNEHSSLEHVKISQNDEHQSEFIRSWKRKVDNMLFTNSKDWLITFENSREYERRLSCSRDFRPMQLANSIYSYNHHPQDSIEGLSMKPKRRRGNLPKSTTALLKEWLAQHKKHPYPTEEEKQLLARETDLSLQQISNWFINARRRHLPHLLENDFGKNSPATRELDIYAYEGGSDHSTDSDSVRRFAKCPARINKTGGIKKPYVRNNKKRAPSAV